MRLWGKVVSGSLVLFAAVFGVVAIAEPHGRGAALAAAAICLAVGLVGVPWLVRLFLSLAGDDQLLATGIPDRAAIQSLRATGWRYNRVYPIVQFQLQLAGDGSIVTLRQAVDPQRLRELSAGQTVGVRVDPVDRRRLVIDWQEPVQGGL